MFRGGARGPAGPPDRLDVLAALASYAAGVEAEEMKDDPKSSQLRAAMDCLNMRDFGSARTNQQTISEFKAAREQAQKEIFQKDRQFAVNLTSNADVKPANRVSPPPPGQCRAILIRQLQQAAVHRGRVLRGVTLVDPMVMTVVQTLLQDEAGDVVTVVLYNVLPEGLATTRERWRAADKLYPAGTALVILEPFYKLMADGRWGVRVDNPAETSGCTLHDDVCIESLKSASHPAPASSSQTSTSSGSRSSKTGSKAAAAASEPSLMSTLLLNLAAAYLRVEEPAPALLLASAAAALDPGNCKGHHKAAVALQQLGHPAAARAAMETAVQVAGPATGKQLLADLQEQARKLPWGKNQQMKGQLLQYTVLVKAAQQHVAAADGALCRADTGSRQQSPAAGAPATDDTCAATQLKQNGNTAFKAGDFQTALQLYRQACSQLYCSYSAAAATLTMRAGCWLELGKDHSHEAVADAAAAVALPGAPATAHQHLVRALMQLGQLDDAAIAASAAVKLYPGVTALQQLVERLATLQQQGSAAGSSSSTASSSTTSSSKASSSKATSGNKASSSRASSSRKRSPGEKAAKDMVQGLASHLAQQEGDKASTEDMVLLNQLMQGVMERMGPEALPGGRGLDSRVVPIHEEFGKFGRWPAQSDVSDCRRRLQDIYENARALPLHLTMMLRSEDDSLSQQFLMARLGSTFNEQDWKDTLNWWANSEFADLRFGPKAPYGAFQKGSATGRLQVHQSFTNTPAVGEFMSAGTVHVAMGFTDLSGLAAAVSAWEEVGGCAKGKKQGPLRWVGFETSAVCVAKALALSAMMLTGATDQQIMQVWYSSAWSRDTLAAFHTALTTLLTAAAAAAAPPPPPPAGPGSTGTSQTPHTSSSGSVSSADAGRSGSSGSAATTTTSSSSSSTQQPATQQQLWAKCSQDLQVLSVLRHWQKREVTLATSRKRWAANDERTHTFIVNFKQRSDRLALCEYVLTGQLGEAAVGSTTMFALPKEIGKLSPEQNFLETLPMSDIMEERQQAGATDIVAAAQQLALRRIGASRRAQQQGEVTIEARCAEVTPGDTTLLASIRSLSPWTISWSNLVDYLHPKEFHAMARACSADEGTVHYAHSMNWIRDVKGASHLDVVLHARDLEKGLLLLLENTQEAYQAHYALLGWEKLLLVPSVDNPRNVLDFGCVCIQYQNWVDAFSRYSSIRRPYQTHVVMPPQYSVLSRVNSTVHFSFTYDPKVKLQVGIGF